jgi:hypothetical protein
MRRFLTIRFHLIVFALGLLGFCVGLWLAWPPLGWIGGGLVLMSISLFGDRKP